MQSKTADAEMVEELFDSALMSCVNCPGSELFSNLEDVFEFSRRRKERGWMVFKGKESEFQKREAKMRLRGKNNFI
jgi:hypothetical protein